MTSLLEAQGELVGGLAGDGFAVVAELGGFVGREEERERAPAVGELGELDLVLGAVELGVEVVDPELVEVAEDDVLRAVGDEADPVVERLPVVLGQVGPALLHLDQDDGFPDVVGEGGAAAVFGGLADAHLGGAADVEGALLAEGLEEAVEEDLGLALLVAGDVGGGPVDEVLKKTLSGLPGFVPRIRAAKNSGSGL